MIPPVLVTDNHSAAERQVFSLLQGLDDQGGGWRCFHSLNLAHHDYKVMGELDFVLLTPLGLLVLEVKGGGVSCADGLWTFTDRFGLLHKRSESPFVQAKSGMFSLRRTLEQSLPPGALTRLAFGHGVVFPDCDFDVHSVEWPSETVLDARRIRADRGMRRYVRGLLDYWRGVAGVTGSAPTEELDEVARRLRPDFDRLPSLRARADQIGVAMERLTESQCDILDAVSESPRILCEGGAGTGKTFIAIEVARRHAALGQKVLLTSRSPHLVRFIADRLHGSMVTVAAYPVSSGGTVGRYDVLVVDEGQDLLDLDALSHLDALLVGGLEAGVWRFFVDVNNQSALLGHFTTEGLELLEGYRSVPVHLNRNCRNTREVVIQTRLLTGADLGVANAGHGLPVGTAYHDDDDGATRDLAAHLDRLHEGGVGPADITVLTSLTPQTSCAARLPDRLRRRLRDFDASTGWPCADTVVARVADFKGLENDFVALVDVEHLDPTPHEISVLYVAMSRARSGLWIGAHRRVENAFRDLSLSHLAAVEREIEHAAG